MFVQREEKRNRGKRRNGEKIYTSFGQISEDELKGERVGFPVFFLAFPNYTRVKNVTNYTYTLRDREIEREGVKC